MTVSVINEYSGIVAFTGTGELNVLGGKERKRSCVDELAASLSIGTLTHLLSPPSFPPSPFPPFSSQAQ